jgi:hypothetical protein
MPWFRGYKLYDFAAGFSLNIPNSAFTTQAHRPSDATSNNLLQRFPIEIRIL